MIKSLKHLHTIPMTVMYIMNIGLEEHQKVYNNTGATILKGKPLYFSGNYTGVTVDVVRVILQIGNR